MGNLVSNALQSGAIRQFPQNANPMATQGMPAPVAQPPMPQVPAQTMAGPNPSANPTLGQGTGGITLQQLIAQLMQERGQNAQSPMSLPPQAQAQPMLPPQAQAQPFQQQVIGQPVQQPFQQRPFNAGYFFGAPTLGGGYPVQSMPFYGQQQGMYGQAPFFGQQRPGLFGMSSPFQGFGRLY